MRAMRPTQRSISGGSSDDLEKWTGAMTTVLDGDGRATIDRRPVTVAVTGLPPGVFRLVVMDGAREAFGVIHHRPGVIVLPRVERPLTIRLLPDRSGEFAAGATLAVRVTTEPTADSAGDDVRVQAVDVSGLPMRDVIVIDVVDDRQLSVTANKVVRDDPLGPLANAARAAARAHLRNETPDPVNMLIAVDTSASMAAPLGWRSVEAVVDVLAGMSYVIGQDMELEVCLLTGGVEELRAAPVRDLAAATRSAIIDTGPGCGFRSAPPELRVRRPSVTYVVTDAVPADVGALRTASGPDDQRHLVLLADGDEPEPPEAVGLAITRVRPASGAADTPAQLLGNQQELLDLVGSLLAGVRP